MNEVDLFFHLREKVFECSRHRFTRESSSTKKEGMGVWDLVILSISYVYLHPKLFPFLVTR